MNQGNSSFCGFDCHLPCFLLPELRHTYKGLETKRKEWTPQPGPPSDDTAFTWRKNAVEMGNGRGVLGSGWSPYRLYNVMHIIYVHAHTYSIIFWQSLPPFSLCIGFVDFGEGINSLMISWWNQMGLFSCVCWFANPVVLVLYNDSYISDMDYQSN
jgi:hypothetical protein